MVGTIEVEDAVDVVVTVAVEDIELVGSVVI